MNKAIITRATKDPREQLLRVFAISGGEFGAVCESAQHPKNIMRVSFAS